MSKEKKKKRKVYYIKLTEKEYEKLRVQIFRSGVRAGKEAFRDKVIDLLDLRNIFETIPR